MKLPKGAKPSPQKFYLQHGRGTRGPFLTEEVPACLQGFNPRRIPRSGYGSKVPTQHMVLWQGRWRRVYVDCYGNGTSTPYILAHQSMATDKRIYCN